MILKGIPASQGIAVGKVVIPENRSFPVQHLHFAKDKTTEYLESFERAREAAATEVQTMLSRTAADSAERDLLKAHAAILSDVEFLAEIRTSITERYRIPEYAVDCACEHYASLLKSGGADAAERIQDLQDVRDRLILKIRHEADLKLAELSEDSILVLGFLRPSEAASMEREHVLGVVTERGGMTSHAAILLRSYGIPAVMGVEDAAKRIHAGDVIALNGSTGEVLTEASEEERKAFAEADVKKSTNTAADAVGTAADCLNGSEEGTYTKDGIRVILGVNAGQRDCGDIFRYGENCGLFRTEFLFMQQDHLMDEEEQTAFYTELLQAAHGKTVTLRTYDLKGDKNVPGMNADSRTFYGIQMRAMLRAGVSGNMRILFPMVRTPEDIQDILDALEDLKRKLRAEGKAFAEHVPVGVMIEIPELAEQAEKVVELCDFASIGTNDLVSFLLREDRESTERRELLPEAAVELIRKVASVFDKAGKPLSVCGEAAGIPDTAEVLVRCGIRELSMAPMFVQGVKQRITEINIEAADESKI